MASDGSGPSRNPTTSGTTEGGLKKTPWTPSEDKILVEFVKMHGEGNWGLVHKKTGLNKSGKSCRNRWANYLRPNLKKGAFSAEEEKLIIELHGKLGNKWARIAAQLPGRTDNEIKNYWNTRLKKCQRTGLAIHPQEMCQTHQPLNSSPSPSFSSLLASFQRQDPNFLCLSNSAMSPNDPSLNIPDNAYSVNQLKFAQDNNGGMASNALFSSPTLIAMPSFNQIFPDSSPMLPVQENNLNLALNPGPNMGALGIPPKQSSPMVTSTLQPFASANVIATRNNGAEDFDVIESGFIQDTEYKATDSVKFLDELLDDVPVSLPIPEWDDLHPRRCSYSPCKY